MKRYLFNFGHAIFTTIPVIILLCVVSGSRAQSIVNTKHNLSVSGPGSIKSTSESEICIFCHTPHSDKAKAPLWNRRDPGSTYILYNSSTSSTLHATTGQPDGASQLCLSCHDGTIALGSVLSRPTEISFARGISTMPEGKTRLGKDLSNDHPVSFTFNSSLSAVNTELKDPSGLTGLVKLSGGKLQCTSCHDPHKNLTYDFLVATTENSTLCLNCHQINNWAFSSHRNSTATWTGRGPNPWTHTPESFNTVSKNACENCHSPHNAGGKAQLMNYHVEESNCLTCHSGSVASGGRNIQVQLSKTYKHNVNAYTGIHDPGEPALVRAKHVECSDCHNPHSSNADDASAPNVKGSMYGVKGVNNSGMPVSSAQYEYEICFRCHSSNAVTGAATSRQVIQTDKRLQFASNNISYHPVETKGRNMDVPGLISPLTVNSMIYCSDCHASNGVGSPAGPHGSVYPQILKEQYSKAENVNESAGAYALCYSCHSRSEYIQDNGDNVRRKIHYKHVVGVKTSCSTCHDPHGISVTQGIPGRNSHLINFSTGVVSPFNGNLYYQEEGNRTGRCYLTCHGVQHNGFSY
ncbi:MAG: NapC/NirT family cytochrome c [Bacteroidetes bacterium]|nr:NapC/NirT family cytochrome c [Bacteroidota bacterium]